MTGWRAKGPVDLVDEVAQAGKATHDKQGHTHSMLILHRVQAHEEDQDGQGDCDSYLDPHTHITGRDPAKDGLLHRVDDKEENVNLDQSNHLKVSLVHP